LEEQTPRSQANH